LFTLQHPTHFYGTMMCYWISKSEKEQLATLGGLAAALHALSEQYFRRQRELIDDTRQRAMEVRNDVMAKSMVLSKQLS
jgi:Ser/Thr protein kinase RdoA (MazF antagonist)